jgi:5-methylcytosine-specific restriction protein A
MLLDRCWVCDNKFGPSIKKEDHHIIPRAYGGIDGPQVSLCSAHHTALHEIALKLYTKKSYFQLLTSDPEVNKKLMYLASVAYNARVATENDPNKKPLLVESVRKETLQKLKKLKSIYRGTARAKLLEAAVDLLYARHFTK